MDLSHWEAEGESQRKYFKPSGQYDLEGKVGPYHPNKGPKYSVFTKEIKDMDIIRMYPSFGGRVDNCGKWNPKTANKMRKLEFVEEIGNGDAVAKGEKYLNAHNMKKLKFRVGSLQLVIWIIVKVPLFDEQGNPIIDSNGEQKVEYDDRLTWQVVNPSSATETESAPPVRYYSGWTWA